MDIFTFVVIVPSWFLSNTVKASLNVASSYNQRSVVFFLLYVLIFKKALQYL